MYAINDQKTWYAQYIRLIQKVDIDIHTVIARSFRGLKLLGDSVIQSLTTTNAEPRTRKRVEKPRHHPHANQMWFSCK